MRLLTALRPILAAALTLPLAIAAIVVRMLPGSRKNLAYLTMLWARALCRVLGIRLKVSGDCKGAPGAMVASNHVSWVDVLVIGSLRPCVFVSKHEVKHWPVLGQLAWLAGTVFLERESRRASFDTLREVERCAASGVSVVIFPEGTPTDGTHLLPFRCMFFEVPAKTGVPVMPVSLAYREPELPWHGGAAFGPHMLGVLGVRRIHAAVHCGETLRPDAASDARQARKRLCANSQEAVRAGLSLVREEVG